MMTLADIKKKKNFSSLVSVNGITLSSLPENVPLDIVT
jgi:hypothetical protein